MLVQKEFLTKLRDFGLNTYESRLWIALLSRGSSTAGELSDIANVPRSRSYDVLESLQKKGFINVKAGKPIRYTAVPPEEVLERRKNIVKEKADTRIDLINELKGNKLLSELISLHTKGSAAISKEDIAGTIRGHNNIQNHLETMLKSAQKKISVFLTAKSLSDESMLLASYLPKAKSKGVEIKIATQQSKEASEAIKLLSPYAIIKATQKKARIVIVDGKEVLFMLYDTYDIHSSYDIGIWLNSEYIAASLEEAFSKEFSMLKKAEIAA